jgi:hypothetical protein
MVDLLAALPLIVHAAAPTMSLETASPPCVHARRKY